MAKRTCSIPNCGKPMHSHGYCGMHTRRFKRHGDPLWEPAELSEFCSVDGCDSKREARGLCHTHYSRWWTTGVVGSAERINQRDRGCSVEDCDLPHCGLGYCVKHYQRFKKYGDPMQVKFVPGSRGAGYVAIHDRVRRAKGRAAIYQCAHCGGAAEDWAYDHADPDAWDVATSRGRMAPVSADPNHYLPLCRTCHRRFDLLASAAR